jgi:ribonuclease-3
MEAVARMASSAQHPGASPASLPLAEPPPTGSLEAALYHHFAHKELLERALTHSSLAHEAGGHAQNSQDNERLEFLGDAVVGLIVADSLYRRYPELPEGALTRLRATLVSRRHLASIAESLGLGAHLRLGRGEERSGGRAKSALLANAMEAVIGAVYLDGGLETARRVIETQVIEPWVSALHEQLRTGDEIGDFKSALQQLLQARKQGQPEYRTTGETGPDHRKRFFVEARVAGQTLAEGAGRTRKHAEQEAARQAIEKLRSTEEAD